MNFVTTSRIPPLLLLLLHTPTDVVLGRSTLGLGLHLKKHTLYYYRRDDVFQSEMHFVHLHVLCARGILGGIQGGPTAGRKGSSSTGEESLQSLHAVWPCGTLGLFYAVFLDKSIVIAIQYRMI